MKYVICLFLSAVVAFVVSSATLSFSEKQENLVEEKQSTLDKIVQNNTIRAGYLLYPPYFMKDSETGEFSGIFYDITEILAKKANLKVDWVEEVGYGEIFTALSSERFDVFAGGLWAGVQRSKAGLFTLPVLYSPVYAWGREDEERFISLEDINRPDIAVAGIDGDMSSIVANADYPKTKKVFLPQMLPYVHAYMHVRDNKADVVFSEASLVLDFNENNKNGLKNLFPEQPVRVFGNSFVVATGEMELKEFLDSGVQELLQSGVVDKIYKKYERFEGAFLPVIKPYEVSYD